MTGRSHSSARPARRRAIMDTIVELPADGDLGSSPDVMSPASVEWEEGVETVYGTPPMLASFMQRGRRGGAMPPVPPCSHWSPPAW